MTIDFLTRIIGTVIFALLGARLGVEALRRSSVYHRMSLPLSSRWSVFWSG